eukprot:scaffold2246_cov162-Amphora_coffeaeformis.AAC.7
MTNSNNNTNNNTNPTNLWTRLHVGHERLKQAVHQGMRVPLPRWGQRVMAFVYFCTPIIGGYYVMQWAISKSHASIGPNGEYLPSQYRNSMTPNDDSPNKTPEPATTSQQPTYGVRLASSDAESQRKSKEKLQRYLRQLKLQQQQESAKKEED